jgi:hypothetical protein
MIGSAIHIIVHLVRFRDGSRRVTSISDVVQHNDELQTPTGHLLGPSLLVTAILLQVVGFFWMRKVLRTD